MKLAKRKGYRLTVQISNKENVPVIQALKDKIINPNIWLAIEKNQYIDKKYLFYCQNHMGNYRLVNWQEL